MSAKVYTAEYVASKFAEDTEVVLKEDHDKELESYRGLCFAPNSTNTEEAELLKVENRKLKEEIKRLEMELGQKHYK